MRGASTPLRGALLGLVLERPGHGGDLANRLRVRLGETWRIDGSDVYRLLEGLEGEGLISAREEPIRGKRRGTRIVYHPTELTSAAVCDWMQTLPPREPIRRGIEAKLAVAREEDLPSVRYALRQHERECLTLAQMITPSEGEPRSWQALFLACTRDGVHRMLQAEIDWAARTLQRIDEHEARVR
jgi:DNA-binding PadR family transcriptional regulator